ncbi:matrix Gla protein isoform X2 [Orcinus orca]|uniref:matrix Gla protein isoform X2 n=1 Tax=Orcinus orca TaxID=9733 RepID=UPI0021119F6B|nr:matrix Gla protein isoform X2 [Orcinus orca]
MRSLLLLSILAAFAVAALCYESHESMESYEIKSENTANLHMRSTGKLVTTSNFANAMPWFMDTMLPTIVISGSAQGPNEIGKSFFPEPGAWFCIPLQ